MLGRSAGDGANWYQGQIQPLAGQTLGIGTFFRSTPRLWALGTKSFQHHSLPAQRVSQREETLIKWVGGGGGEVSCDVPVLNLGVAFYPRLEKRSRSQDCSRTHKFQHRLKARSSPCSGLSHHQTGKMTFARPQPAPVSSFLGWNPDFF